MTALTAPKLGATGTVTVSDELFGAEWHEHLVWHAVRNELLGRRQGTHKVKTRGEVRGGGAKPWRQKGTGRARQGTRTAPQWTGGGVVFGPTPRSYGGKVNRKELQTALRCALSLHQGRGSLAVLPEGAFAEPSTKAAKALRDGWKFENSHRKLTVVCTVEEDNVQKSFRNLEDVMVVSNYRLDVADVLWGHGLIITEAALAALSPRDGGDA